MRFCNPCSRNGGGIWVDGAVLYRLAIQFPTDFTHWLIFPDPILISVITCQNTMSKYILWLLVWQTEAQNGPDLYQHWEKKGSQNSSPWGAVRLSVTQKYSRIFSIVESHNRSLTRKYNKTSDIVNFDLFTPIRRTICNFDTGIFDQVLFCSIFVFIGTLEMTHLLHIHLRLKTPQNDSFTHNSFSPKYTPIFCRQMAGASGVTNGHFLYGYQLKAAHLFGKLLSIATQSLPDYWSNTD